MNYMSSKHPSSGPDFDPLVAARVLRPLLLESAEQAEKDRRVPSNVMDAISDAGILRMTMPKRAGGSGCTTLQLMETIAELGRADMGIAWAAGLLAGVTGLAGSLPATIRDGIFVTGRELVCGVSGASNGSAVPTSGGYLVSGNWPYASGCYHAHWAMLGVMVKDEDETDKSSGLIFLPLDSPGLSIKDTWKVAGVAASGSNTIVCDNVFVPSRMVIGNIGALDRSGSGPDAEPRDRWPAEITVPLGVIAPMLGAAEAMHELVTAGMSKKTVPHWMYGLQKDSDVLTEHLGTAKIEIESAWLHIQRAAGMCDIVVQQRPLTGIEKARSQADCGHAMSLVRSAANRLMDISGSGAFANANPLQRFWRDINVGSRHAFLSTYPSMELYGRLLLGRSSNNIQFKYAD